MDSLKRPPFPSRFSRGPVCRLIADLPLDVVDGSPVLPDLLLWALSLNAGDLLIVSPSRGADRMEWVFASYREIVIGCAQSCTHPWPYVEESLLYGRLAAVGVQGELRLPDEAAALVRPGCAVRLRKADDPLRRQFSLYSPQEERLRSSQFFVQAEYLLAVEPGLRVFLPEEALWALGLAAGERLVGEAYLADVRFAASAASPRVGGRGKRITVDLEADGSLALPESLRVETVLRPQARVRLIVTLSPRPEFTITQWLEID
jgi:hypothetical protein